jgi:hypothetical protein
MASRRGFFLGAPGGTLGVVLKMVGLAGSMAFVDGLSGALGFGMVGRLVGVDGMGRELSQARGSQEISYEVLIPNFSYWNK